MMASVEGCIVETCADSTKEPKVECGMFVGLSLFSAGGNEPEMSSCKLPDAPQDVSPKSLSSFTETLSMMETIPVVKSHKRQRSDAMVENSPARDSFLVHQYSSVADSQRAGPLVDSAEDMCKPRAVYPVNFKAPKTYSSPQSGRSRDLEIPIGGGSGAGEWSQLRSPSDPSFLSNFNIGFFNKGNFPANNNVSDHRRLSRHRSRANSRNNINNNGAAVFEQVDAPSEDADHSQISIDLERISLAATSFSPFTSPRPTLRPSPLLPVVFSPIQPVAYRSFVTGMIEGTSAMKEEEEEEDQELVINLPTEERHASTCGAVPSLNSHTYHHHQQQQEHYLYKPNNYLSQPSSVHIVTLPHNKITPPPTYEAAYTHGLRADPMVVEASELLDEDMLIFNMDA